MLSLARREFASFFQSATGVLVLSVYLGLNAVFLWLMPGSFHLLDSGYAQLDGLFMLSPWVFLFLVPALAMRMLAEERRASAPTFCHLVTFKCCDHRTRFSRGI